MDNQLLGTIATRAIGLPRASIRVVERLPTTHQTNKLYDVFAGAWHLIAKEYSQVNEENDCARREFAALNLFAPLDLAPRAVFYDASLAPIVVYEFMPGEMWDRRKPSPAELTALADAWIKLQSIATEKLWLSNGTQRTVAETGARIRARFEAYAEWARENFLPAQEIATECIALLDSRRAVIEELDARPPRVCFCRADPRFANVIARPDSRIGFVDWEDSGLRDPARELADILLHPNNEDLLTRAEWNAFIAPYLEFHAPRDPEIWHRTGLYLALFPLFWLSVFVAQGMKLTLANRLDQWRINWMPANDRMRRYLARARDALDFDSHLVELDGAIFFPIS